MKRITTSLCALAFALAGALASPAPAEEHCHGDTAAALVAAPKSLETLAIPDLTLTDQDGRPVAVRELLAGPPVAMNFVFTSCTTICPPQGATFARLARQLAERTAPAQPVRLVSVSIDPAVDTPARLKAWRDKLGGAPGWTLLTGSKPQVTALLKALQVFTPDKAAHSPVALVGDGAGHWRRLYGLPSPGEILAALDGLASTSPAAPEVTR